ncbi:MAG: ribonuclease Z [Bacteroidota bacterium]|nr:ribonuclease Z [Bacteroidota bacterium]
MEFYVKVLGSSSAIIQNKRGVTSHYVFYRGTGFLVDCGEGTQIQIRRFGVRMQKIEHIFISHLHGDHFFGLIGLLSTYHLYGRQKELHLYAAEPLKEIIKIQLEASETILNYPLIFHAIEDDFEGLLFENNRLEVSTFKLVHQIPTHGFLFKEKPKPRRINLDVVKEENIPERFLKGIKLGDDFVKDSGEILKNVEITLPPLHSRSYAFCSDTGYNEKILPWIKDVDLLYHETTYLNGDSPSERLKKYHSTATDAANIALKANARRLLIGHFSSRYGDLVPFLNEAKRVFNNTLLAIDGNLYKVKALTNKPQ